MKRLPSARCCALSAARLTLLACVAALAAGTSAGPGAAKDRRSPVPVPHSPPRAESLPPDIAKLAGLSERSLSEAVADTFHLAWYSFDNNGPDPQGWTTHDRTTQTTAYFHVADGTELDGGQLGTLLPLEGTQSAWCGKAATQDPAYCAWVSLPGYGNDWRQQIESKTVYGDSIRLYYKVRWDVEDGYDNVYVDVISSWNGPRWQNRKGYTGKGSATECLVINFLGDSTRIRFRVEADGLGSDEDGLYASDGAALLDSIVIECFTNGVLTTTFSEELRRGRHFYRLVAKGFDETRKMVLLK